MNAPLLKSLALRLAVLGLLVVPAAAETLTALGRVLPRSGVVDLTGIAGDTVQEILVREGDWVEPGQPLARLSSAAAARQRVAQAEADLAGTQATAARDQEIARQKVALAEAEAKFAEERYERILAAKNSEFTSPDQLEERGLARKRALLGVDQARLGLEQTGREAARAVRAAEADLAAARGQLALAEVQSPLKARVLKTRTRVGALVGRNELFKLGDTSRMIVVAEVYEADILRVKPGQKATVGSAALPKKMTGRVESVSSVIHNSSVQSLDPNDNGQARIVEVTIVMDEAEPLDRLVLLQVDVVLDL